MKRATLFAVALILCMGAEAAKADFTFGEPVNLGPPINSPYDESGVCISANGLEFYFQSNRSGGYGGYDLWVMKRPTIEDDWGDPENLGSPANSQYSYWEPSISSDGLSLYFSDGHSPQYGNHLPGGLGGQGDIWMITRETIQDAWGAPVNIGLAVNRLNAVHPSISTDGLSLYFQSHQGGICDIMVATRESTSNSFGNPEKPVFLKNVNSTVGEWMPDISADGRALFFNRIRKLWMSTRATIYDDFGPPLKLPPQLNISNSDSPSISPDGSTLYFTSARPGGIGNLDIWQVSISPIVDFNGDEIIDSADMCIMVDHWGEDYSLCDVGPTPFGDGVVDVEDLKALAEHLFEEVNDPTLVAHWTLDETEGTIALDSAGGNVGNVVGDPLWQPDAGQAKGAIQLDGIDDCIVTSSALNPTDGPFSVFVWVKGGAPGQSILSQSDGVNWLHATAAEGYLATDIVSSGRTGNTPMQSATTITDGKWHRISFVWDGLYRRLYIDGLEVARDVGTLADLKGSETGLNIGVGKDHLPGTYWSGLIDDGRIYNRAVKP